MPSRNRFETSENWYNTLFHELAHSTGHRSRLGRFAENAPYPTLHERGREEMTAEMATALLLIETGLPEATLENSASYIQHWKEAIAADKEMVVRAASAAQKAADYILRRETESDE